ncbi:hypothetical protein V492_03782 [Pseudogymnoascus sp. VKM F-4246]|nr:hypothetical protein V492_03782 [Pseudogymnoascus sp. VKM F-4246]
MAPPAQNSGQPQPRPVRRVNCLPNLHITETGCTVLFSSPTPSALRSQTGDRGEGRTGTIPGCAACSYASSEHDRPPSKFRASIVEEFGGGCVEESHSTHPPPNAIRGSSSNAGADIKYRPPHPISPTHQLVLVQSMVSAGMVMTEA